MDDYPGDGSEMTGPGIGNEKRGKVLAIPRFSLPGAHRLAAKYEFLILEVEAAELNLESTDALPLVASGRAGNDERCRNFSIVCDCLTRVFEGLGRNRVVERVVTVRKRSLLRLLKKPSPRRISGSATSSRTGSLLRRGVPSNS